MRSLNQIIKVRSCRAIVFALLVYQLVAHSDSPWQVEPHAGITDVEISRSVQTFSVTRDKQGDHRKRENQNRATKKPSQILPGHHPDKLAENTQSTFGPANLWLDLKQNVFERFEGEGALISNFFILNHISAKRAPPSSFS
jgi:hypothetical protein